MTDRRHSQIGIDRLVRLAWLEKTSSLVLAGNGTKEVKEVLQQDLQGSFRSNGQAVRGSIDKTITILMKVWANSPSELCVFQAAGLELLKQAPRSAHIAVHWGMVMAVYPFWANVAAQVGRLLRLQDSVVATQVQRRMREQYGERETVSRRTRYALRSFIDWGVMKESDDKGVYVAANVLPIADPQVIAWLFEAQLHANPKGRDHFSSLNDAMCIFPFQFTRVGCRRVVSMSDRLELLPDGSADEMIGLRAERDA